MPCGNIDAMSQTLATPEWKAHFVPNPEKFLHVVPSPATLPSNYEDAFREMGYRVFRLDGAKITGKETLFRAVAAEMGFPDYFGHNWDALEECLRDMEWAPAQGYVTILESAREFIQSSPEDFFSFLDSGQTAAESWAGEGAGFHFILVGDGVAGLLAGTGSASRLCAHAE
jgi:RNAse (barnase) inhibitor barstar